METIKNYADLITLHVDGKLFKRRMTFEYYRFETTYDTRNDSDCRECEVLMIVYSLFREFSIETGYKKADYFINDLEDRGRVEMDAGPVMDALLANGAHTVTEEGQPQLAFMLNRLHVQIEPLVAASF